MSDKMDHERPDTITGEKAVQRRSTLVGEAATGLAMQQTQTAEAEERLEALSPDFREVVRKRYAQKYVAVRTYIEEGILPEVYCLPPLGELMDHVEAVAPAYEAINNITGGNAGFDFTLKRLNDKQKNKLAISRTLPNGQITKGAYDFNAGQEAYDPTNSLVREGRLWGAVAMDISESPILRGISPDGSQAIAGVNLEQAMRTMATFHDAIKLPKPTGEEGLSAAELLICQISPNKDDIFGIQLGRLERGEQPFDLWTICKENVTVKGAVCSVILKFGSVCTYTLSTYHMDCSATDKYTAIRMTATS